MASSTYVSVVALLTANLAEFAFAQVPSVSASSSAAISVPSPGGSSESFSEASMPKCWNSCFGQYQVTSEYALCEAPLKTEVTSCITTSCTQADNSTAITAYSSWLSNYCGIPSSFTPAPSAPAEQQTSSSSTAWWTPSLTAAEQTTPPAESSVPAETTWWTPSSSAPAVPESSAAAQNTWWTPSSAVTAAPATSAASVWSSSAAVGVSSVPAYSNSTWTTSAQAPTNTATVATETSAGFSQETGYVNAGSVRTIGGGFALFVGILLAYSCNA